jgi:hypothetical protein
MSSPTLSDYETTVFWIHERLIAKKQKKWKRGWVKVNYPPKHSANESFIENLKNCNPMNRTTLWIQILQTYSEPSSIRCMTTTIDSCYWCQALLRGGAASSSARALPTDIPGVGLFLFSKKNHSLDLGGSLNPPSGFYVAITYNMAHGLPPIATENPRNEVAPW